MLGGQGHFRDVKARFGHNDPYRHVMRLRETQQQGKPIRRNPVQMMRNAM
jgi:hypothetical protein